MTWNIHDLKPRRTGSAPLRNAPRVAESRAPSHHRSIFDSNDDEEFCDEGDASDDDWNLDQLRDAQLSGILSPRQWHEWGRHMRRGIEEV